MDKMIFVLLFFTIVVGVPVIGGIVADIYKRKLAFKERELELTSQLTAEKTAQYAAHTERLEQRVRVLERIITDKGVEVADQIEALRDRPQIDKPLN